MVKLFYSKPAIEDLQNIHNYISLDSRSVAKRFVSGIKERIKILKKYPELGSPVYPEKFSNLRQALYKSYRIIYQLTDDAVTIITIPHQARLLENIPALKKIL